MHLGCSLGASDGWSYSQTILAHNYLAKYRWVYIVKYKESYCVRRWALKAILVITCVNFHYLEKANKISFQSIPLSDYVWSDAKVLLANKEISAYLPIRLLYLTIGRLYLTLGKTYLWLYLTIVVTASDRRCSIGEQWNSPYVWLIAAKRGAADGSCRIALWERSLLFWADLKS